MGKPFVLWRWKVLQLPFLCVNEVFHCVCKRLKKNLWFGFGGFPVDKLWNWAVRVVTSKSAIEDNEGKCPVIHARKMTHIIQWRYWHYESQYPAKTIDFPLYTYIQDHSAKYWEVYVCMYTHLYNTFCIPIRDFGRSFFQRTGIVLTWAPRNERLEPEENSSKWKEHHQTPRLPCVFFRGVNLSKATGSLYGW